MKAVFLVSLALLAGGTAITWMLSGEIGSDVPVIYWVTDDNPTRQEQVTMFHQWLVENGHTKKGDPTQPAWQLRVDTSPGADVSKKIIQGVSGVCGDVMDLWSASGDILYFRETGLLCDVTQPAQRMGFDPSHTWPAIQSELTIRDADGQQHQYAFPCNVAVAGMLVNVATFRKLGLEVPPRRMSLEEFERRGKEFVAVANRGQARQTVFFADGLDITATVLGRSLGVSQFNETLTRCTLGDERYARAYALEKKWMEQDHILPTLAEQEAFATQSGYLGSRIQLFKMGNYGMMWSARNALVQLRKVGVLELAVVEHPNGGFPNTFTATRAAAVYQGSKHKEGAELFLAYLASRQYSLQVVRDSDGLPPDPKETLTDEFRRPTEHPNEWACHQEYARAMDELAIGNDLTPFVSVRTVSRTIDEYRKAIYAGRYSPREAVTAAQNKINDEIDRTVRENPRLKPWYDSLTQRQRLIDERTAVWKEIGRLTELGQAVPADLTARAEKIPLAWIESAYYRTYYRYKGWAE